MKDEDKHAYLIMCHNNFKHLSKLLMALDDVRNDIYIHVDKKVVDFPFKDIEKSVKETGVTWVNRVSVGWGGFAN